MSVVVKGLTVLSNGSVIFESKNYTKSSFNKNYSFINKDYKNSFHWKDLSYSKSTLSIENSKELSNYRKKFF